jgi:6-phosphogluconolactonase (cycloisomerase 2 family)
MTRYQKLFVCLAAAFCTGAALAQASTGQTSEATASTSSPVAFVYVSRPTHIDAFAASSTGVLTPVPGSPFSGIAVSSMSVNKKFLFGAGDNGEDVYSFSIQSNGAIEQVSEINVQNDDPEGVTSQFPLQVDASGTTLYTQVLNNDTSQTVQSFKIEQNGDLQFLGNANYGNLPGEYALSPPYVLGNNQ